MTRQPSKVYDTLSPSLSLSLVLSLSPSLYMTLSLTRSLSSQAAQAAHARRFRPLPVKAKPGIDTVAAQLKQTRSALGKPTTDDDVQYFKERMAEKRRDLSAAASTTKAMRIVQLFYPKSVK